MTTRAAVPTLSAAIVGATAGPLMQSIDARWLMAYAAALGEADPRFYDTAAVDGPVAHPLFAVCYEWPLARELRARTIGEPIAARAVHASHHVILHRRPCPGDRLATTARIVGLSSHRAGTLVMVAFETADAQGRPVTTTRYGSIYRGVQAETDAAEPQPETPPARAARGPLRWESPIQVPAHAAHVYTEGARIWNPIHTDLAAARAAGLPGPILHGTATLALAVSRVVAHDLEGEPARVRGVGARFTGLVRLPSTFIVRGYDDRADGIVFDAVDTDGHPVLSDGTLRR